MHQVQSSPENLDRIVGVAVLISFAISTNTESNNYVNGSMNKQANERTNKLSKDQKERMNKRSKMIEQTNGRLNE